MCITWSQEPQDKGKDAELAYTDLHLCMSTWLKRPYKLTRLYDSVRASHFDFPEGASWLWRYALIGPKIHMANRSGITKDTSIGVYYVNKFCVGAVQFQAFWPFLK